jgi:hypothetical protein
MATITNPPGESSVGPAAAVHEPPAYERYIETQLRRARRQVRAVDLASNLLALTAVLFGYVLVLLVADHWLVPGGLPAWIRLLVWLAAVGGGAAWTAVCVWPLLVRSINPVFAARTIERSEPGLKNTLVNFLLLRRRPESLPPQIFRAVGEQAAERLAVVPIETVVDRSRVIRLLWLVLGVFLALALAAIGLLIEGAAPSHLYRSVGRVVVPWAEIAPPTRVVISDVQPGPVSIYQGERVRVSALVRGLREGEAVVLHYTTADGQAVDQQSAMQRAAGGQRYQGEFPPTGPGLGQDATYWITAGDAASETYQVRALTAPAIVVDRVEYRYPRYTELEPRSVARQGDVHGIEGTVVTIHATANQEIQTAMLDFECDGRRDLTMRAEGRTAWAQFRLSWDEAAGRPEHSSYQVRFINAQGHENPHPVRYKIDCFRDEPPAVAFEKPDTPPDREVVLELGQALPLVITAADADYKLSSVVVRFERAGELLHEEPLLIDGPRAGSFRRAWLFHSGRYGLKEGDVLRFWAEARDNRQPDDDRPLDPNVSSTPKYTLRILPCPPQDQPPQQGDERQPQGRQGRPQAQQPNQPQPNQPQQGQPQPDQPQQGDPQAQAPENSPQQAPPRRQKGQPPEGAQQPQQGEPQEDQPENGQPQQGQPQQGQPQQGQPQQGQPQQGQPQQGQPQEGGQQHKPPKSGQQAPDAQDGNPQDGNGSDSATRSAEGQRAEGQPGQHPLEDLPPSDNQQSPAQDQPSNSQRPKEPIDPDSDPGRAIEEILKHRQQRPPADNPPQPQQPSQQQPGQQRQPEPGTQSGEQPQQNMPQPAQQQPGAPAGKEGQTPDKQSPTPAQPDRPPADSPQPGQNLPPGDMPPNEQAVDSPDPQAAGQQETKPSGTKQAGNKGNAASQASGEAQPGQQPEKDGQTPSPGQAGEQPDDLPAQAAREGEDQAKPSQPGKNRSGKGGDVQGNGERPDQPQQDRQDGQQRDGEEPMGSDSESPDRGSPGAARRGHENEGSPAPQEGNFDKQKHPTDQEQPSDVEDEAQSPTTSRRQSDAEGGQAGNRSGSGGQGGGQRSPSQGTGSAGQNTAADDGGGQANQKGQGPTAESGGDSNTSGTSPDGSGTKVRQPGGKKQGGSKKGGRQAGGGQASGQQASGEQASGEQASGEPAGGKQPEPGQDSNQSQENNQPDDTQKGRQQRSAGKERQNAQPGQASEPDRSPQAGQQPAEGTQPAEGQQQDEQPAGDPQANADQQGAPGQPGSQPGDGTASPTGGSGQPADGLPDRGPPPEVPQGDDPNLDYARRATDLALEYLKDQLAKEQPDQELLDRLGWTREDMQRFVDRWEALKQAAGQPGEKGKQAQVELDDLLRSLGLRPQGAALSGGTGEGTRVSNTREAARSDPPSAYAEKYRAFTRGKKRRIEKKE